MLIALFLTLLFVPAAYLKWHGRSATTQKLLSDAQSAIDSARSPPAWLPFSCWVAPSTRDRAGYPVQLQRTQYARSDSPAMRALVDLQESGYETDYSIQLTASNEQAASALKARLETLPSVKAVNLPLDFAPAHDVDRSASLKSSLKSTQRLSHSAPKLVTSVR